jgi:predicted DNA-binding protein YlxM (UPF0122 family)
MTNQYCESEINEIISLYSSGMSLSKMREILKRKKDNIKKILIENNVWVEERDVLKKSFNEKEIILIKKMYLNENLSTQKIANNFNVSKEPITRILKELQILRRGNSSGIKINLTEKQKENIKNLYLNEYKSVKEIGKIIGCSDNFISKYLAKNKLLRSRGEATTLSKTGKKLSEKTIKNMKQGQRNLVLSGKRKQTGGVCKTFIVENLTCKGTYEKSYIEYLLKNNKILPENCNMIMTPHGGYYPDFKYPNKFIEIKSPYTYDILLGIKKSRWSNQYDYKQLKKIKWVNENIMPVEIVVFVKNNIMKINTL